MFNETKLDSTDAFLLLFLSISSVIVHFWMIHNPDCVVFDEVHFGNFTNWYSTSEYFFDIHPPLGKLVMFYFSNLSEYNASINFERLYAKKHETNDFIFLRIIPAFFSSLCVPMIYLSMRFSSFCYSSSFLSAFMALCDTSLLTEHRFILSDGMLHFFCCLFIVVFSYTSSIRRKGNYSTWFNISAVLLGCACACKNTAWGLIPYAGWICLCQLMQMYRRIDWDFMEEIVYECVLLGGIAIVVHLLAFAVHIVILPFSGQGTNYMPEIFRNQFINKDHISAELWAKRLKWPSLYFRIVTLAVNMHFGNMGIKDFHPYMSRPINWPLLTGNWVAFWAGGSTEVDCMGNVFVYYLSFFSLFLILFGFKRTKWDIGLRFLLGWVVSYFPFFLIPRSMYLYHYLIPLIFGCMCTGAAIEIWLPPKGRGILCVLLCALVIIGFIFWSPLSYGTPHLDTSFIIWTDRWQFGDKYHQKLAEDSRKK